MITHMLKLKASVTQRTISFVNQNKFKCSEIVGIKGIKRE